MIVGLCYQYCHNHPKRVFCRATRTEYFDRISAKHGDCWLSDGWLLALVLLVATCAAFLLFLYAGFVSKVLPPTGVSLLDAMRDDWFYCYLVPMVGPTTFIAVYMNWVAMKFFRHN